MAYAMTKQGSLDNCITYEFICDTIEDMNAIENRYRTIGTIAIVLQGDSGLEVYISGSDKQWNSLSSISGSSGAGSAAGLAIHICGQDEVSEGLPDVSEPDETTIYLVPAEDEQSGNLYDEYIYVDGDWEKFGSGNMIDLTGYYQKPVNGIPASDLASGVIPDVSIYAPIDSPVFTGSISQGRKANAIIGENSFTNGENVAAGGISAHAEGKNTIAEGNYSHAEGYNTWAANSYAHTEGNMTRAEGENSHAEGNNTLATGANSHTEGVTTTAAGIGAHAEGCGNGTLSYYVDNIKYIGSGAHGQYSHTEGGNSWTFASYAHAEGNNTYAVGQSSHTEGESSHARGQASHAEGRYAEADGIYSHAEGYATKALGESAHAQGYFTVAAGGYQQVIGRFNIEDNFNDFPEWTANTQYTKGDGVKRTITENGITTVKSYICSIANNDATFISSKWFKNNLMRYVEIVGNGNETSRSNARALDWNGNEYLMGDLYVKCDSTSQNGVKVVTEAVLASLINRIIVLENKVAYLEGQHIPETAVTDETGTQITDESSNFITYNN